MPTARENKLKGIQKDIKRVRKDIKSSNKALEDLTTRLAELEVYTSGSDNEVPDILVGNRVTATTNPHKNRIGTVISSGKYWVHVKADWEIVLANGKTSKNYKKAKHNLRVLDD